MKQLIPSDEERGGLSPEQAETVVRCARARRDAALGLALGRLFHRLAAAVRRSGRALDEARRLRALAMLDDRRLAALGLARGDLPGIVYGWTVPAPPAPPSAPVQKAEPAPPPHRQRAA